MYKTNYEAGYIEVREKLEKIFEEMKTQRAKLTESKEKFLLAKAKYDMEYNQAYLKNKASEDKLTIPELKATAEIAAYEQRMKVIISESSYRKDYADFQDLERRYESIMEYSRMVRKQLERET